MVTITLPVVDSVGGTATGANAICTSKYTLLSFIPKVLFLQYRRASEARFERSCRGPAPCPRRRSS